MNIRNDGVSLSEMQAHTGNVNIYWSGFWLVIMFTCTTSAQALWVELVFSFISSLYHIPPHFSRSQSPCLALALSHFIFTFWFFSAGRLQHQLQSVTMGALCVTFKCCSPSLEHPTVISKKEQRDPCLNSGKNTRQLMQPHYVNALCSYELWPQLKLTQANYGQ